MATGAPAGPGRGIQRGSRLTEREMRCPEVECRGRGSARSRDRLVCWALSRLLARLTGPMKWLAICRPAGLRRAMRAYFGADKDWTAYGGTSAGTRYSRLDQITPQNVRQLQVAWTFHTGDLRGPGDPVETTYEVTPLKVDQTLYLCTPHDLVFALNAETGQELWRYDPKIRQPPAQSTQHLTCRGLSYFDGDSGSGTKAGNAPSSGECGRRLFLPTVDGRLVALDAETGKTCAGFGGPEGAVDLWQNMPNITPGSYYSTSPPVIAEGSSS